MSKSFYDHLIIFEEVEIALSKQKLSASEKAEISLMIKETIHHRVLARILTHLPREHHQEFLKSFAKTPDDMKILSHLKEKVADIEELIKDELKTLEKELLEDLL